MVWQYVFHVSSLQYIETLKAMNLRFPTQSHLHEGEIMSIMASGPLQRQGSWKADIEVSACPTRPQISILATGDIIKLHPNHMKKPYWYESVS